MFVASVLKPTYGILDWAIQVIRNTDIKTKKLTITGNFHINNDVDCLYIPRSEGLESNKNCLQMWNSFLEPPCDKK